MKDMEKRRLGDVKALPRQYRELSMEVVRIARAEGAPEDAPQLYELSFSSSAEIERWYGVEVLEHTKKAVDLSRMKAGAAVLVDHCGDQVGVVREAWLDEAKGKCRARVEFSRGERGQEVERDVADGIRQNVSVGYVVKKAQLVEERQNGVEVWSVSRWQPCEVSIVSVPADITVGVGREQGRGESPVELEDGRSVREDEMSKPNGAAQVAVEDAPVVGVEVVREAEQKRASDIVAMCEANGLASQVRDFIGSTLSVEQVSERIAAMRATKGSAQPRAEALAAVPEKERRSYSYLRAISRVIAEADGSGSFDGLEAEVAQELARQGTEPKRGGRMLPLSLRTTLTSITSTKGVETVFDQPGDLIELLRAKARVIESGAFVMTGLNGPVGFPKQKTAATVNWLPETGTATDGDPTLGLSTLSPKTLQGNIPFTRQLMAQSTLDVETWVRNELALAHALAIDKGAIHGTGASGQPLGIYGTTGVNVKAMGSAAPTYIKLMNMVSAVYAANADADKMRWLTTPQMAGQLASTLEFPAAAIAQGGKVWSGSLSDGIMCGYNASSTTQVSAVMTGSAATGGSEHGIVFGNFADMIIGFFGNGLEVIVDPYSLKKQGIIEVTTFQMADVLIRHGESFAKATEATVA